MSAWSDRALNALALQWFAGDVRESGLADAEDLAEAWRDYVERAEQGQCPSSLYVDCEAQRIYWSCAQ